MIKVLDTETVERWRREERIDAALAAFGRWIAKGCWWLVLFFAGYIAALLVEAGRAAQ